MTAQLTTTAISRRVAALAAAVLIALATMFAAAAPGANAQPAQPATISDHGDDGCFYVTDGVFLYLICGDDGFFDD